MRVIPELKEGSLGGKGFFSKSAGERIKIEENLAEKIGEKRVTGKLRAIQVFNKNRDPALSGMAKSDADYISGSFRDKTKVKYPKGFSTPKKYWK